MKITKVDQKCLDLICQFEGFSEKPYICPAGVPTIGYGSTRYPSGNKVTMNDSHITKEFALQMLAHDVKAFELSVDALCIDTITQNQFNALVSFCYNLGAGALKQSTLLKKLNVNQNDKTIRDEFMKWCYAGKTKLAGLERRRKAEADLYFTV